MNTQVPTVLKKTSGLSSSRVGARRFLGRSPASSGVGRPAGGARTFCSSFREIAPRKVHGVNAIGAEVESHAPLRHAGRVSRMTIRRMQSNWCQTPGEHVSDETAHTPSLSQRDLAVLQHCV